MERDQRPTHRFPSRLVSVGPGDLAYQYRSRDALTGIELTAALDALSSANFGAQALRPFSGLQEGLVKLS